MAGSSATAPVASLRAAALVQLTLAVIAGGGAANIYYNQPVLGLLSGEFGPAAAVSIATATLLGYGAGILLLVPLGDRWPRRSMILIQQVALAAALALAAAAPNLAVLTLASVAIGVTATSAQHAIPFAAELAPDHARGGAVGRAMTGLFLGILLARTISGGIAAHHGWRPVFAVAAGLALVLAALAALVLPQTQPTTRLGYRALMGSLVALVREEPVLRRSTLAQGCIFAAFNAFWASLALHLEGPPFGLGPSSAGLFGLVGAAGALVAPFSGRLADRQGPRAVVIWGAAIVLASFGLLALLGRTSLVGIGLGVLVLDIGVSLAMIANQTRIYALRPEARGRLNTVFVTGMFLAGALGAALGTRGYAAGGWLAVSAFGALFAAGAVVAALAGRSAAR